MSHKGVSLSCAALSGIKDPRVIRTMNDSALKAAITSTLGDKYDPADKKVVLAIRYFVTQLRIMEQSLIS